MNCGQIRTIVTTCAWHKHSMVCTVSLSLNIYHPREKLKYGVAVHKHLAFANIVFGQHCSKRVCFCKQIHDTDI